MNWKEYELNRFGEGCQQSFTGMIKQVKEMEKFFGIRPFPKYKHPAVIVKNGSNSVR